MQTKTKHEPFLSRFHTHSRKTKTSFQGWFHFPLYNPKQVNKSLGNLELQLIGFIGLVYFFNWLDYITNSPYGTTYTSMIFAFISLVSWNIFTILFYGRDGGYFDHNTISLECYWGKRVDHLSCQVRLSNDADDKVVISLSVPKLFSIYLSFDLGYSYLIKLTNLRKSNKYWRNNGKGYFFEPYHGHSTGFSFGKEYCYIDFLHCSADSEFNRWFSFHKGWDTETILYGKLDIDVDEQYIPFGLEKPEYTVTIKVPKMGEYPSSRLEVKVSYKRIVHTRKRWKKPFEWISTNIQGISATGPLERNGKGENGWDCEPVDMSLPELSTGSFIHPDNVADYYINHIKEQRAKYG